MFTAAQSLECDCPTGTTYNSGNGAISQTYSQPSLRRKLKGSAMVQDTLLYQMTSKESNKPANKISDDICMADEYFH